MMAVHKTPTVSQKRRHEPLCVLEKVHIRLVSNVKIRRSHIVIRFAETGVDLLYVFKKVFAVHAFLQNG